MTTNPTPSSPPPLAAALKLRPLSTSEILDRSFEFYRAHFFPLFLFGCLVNSIPFLAATLTTFFGWTPQDQTLSLFSKESLFSSYSSASFILSYLVLLLGQGAMTHYVSEAYQGRSITIRQAIYAIRGKSFPLLLTLTFKILVLSLIFSFPLIPLFLMYFFSTNLFFWQWIALGTIFVLLFAPGFILLLRWIMTIQVIIIDRQAGLRALVRSSQLTRYKGTGKGFFSWGETRLSLVLLLIFITSILMAMVSSLPTLITRFSDLVSGSIRPIPASFSEEALMLTHLLNFLGDSFIVPLYIVATTLFYFDVLIRKEGWDLQMLAESLEKTPVD